MIKVVAFDLDGTIGDTIPMCIAAFKKAVTPYASKELSDEDVVKTFGLNEEGMIREVVGDNWQQALSDFYVIYEQMHTMCTRPLEGIKAMIEDLKANSILVTLITGKGEKSCAITLRQFGMQSCFDKIATGSNTDKNTKAIAINQLMINYNLLPNEILYVGDAVSDVTACRSVDVMCLSAAWIGSSSDIEQLEQYNQGNVFYSIESLRFFLMQLLNNSKPTR